LLSYMFNYCSVFSADKENITAIAILLNPFKSQKRYF
jgi:hypothetical protein